jgi:hypothetical protein
LSKKEEKNRESPINQEQFVDQQNKKACAQLEHDAIHSEHTTNQHDTTPARPKEARAAARRRLDRLP